MYVYSNHVYYYERVGKIWCMQQYYTWFEYTYPLHWCFFRYSYLFYNFFEEPSLSTERTYLIVWCSYRINKHCHCTSYWNTTLEFQEDKRCSMMPPIRNHYPKCEEGECQTNNATKKYNKSMFLSCMWHLEEYKKKLFFKLDFYLWIFNEMEVKIVNKF